MKYCPNSDCPFIAEHGIVAEFQNSINRCPDCGTDLEIGNAPDPETLPKQPLRNLDPDSLRFVTLAVFSSEEDVQLCRNVLHEARIQTTVYAPDAGEGDWDLQDAYGVAQGKAVIVRESDLPRALQLLANIEEFWEGEEEDFDEDEYE